MEITDELKEIRSEIQAAGQVKEALNSKMTELENAGPSSPSFDKPRGTAKDMVSQDVITKEEIKGLYREVEDAEQKLGRRADAIRDRLKSNYSLEVIQRLVIEMYYLDGKTMSVIASTIGKGRSTCKKILHRAMSELTNGEKTTEIVRMDENNGNAGRASKAS